MSQYNNTIGYSAICNEITIQNNSVSAPQIIFTNDAGVNVTHLTAQTPTDDSARFVEIPLNNTGTKAYLTFGALGVNWPLGQPSNVGDVASWNGSSLVWAPNSTYSFTNPYVLLGSDNLNNTVESKLTNNYIVDNTISAVKLDSTTALNVNSIRDNGLVLGVVHSDVSGNFTSSNIVDADISNSAAILASKLSGYPSDNTKYLSGAGNWNVLSSGDVISDIGVAVVGQVCMFSNVDGKHISNVATPAELSANTVNISSTVGAINLTSANHMHTNALQHYYLDITQAGHINSSNGNEIINSTAGQLTLQQNASSQLRIETLDGGSGAGDLSINSGANAILIGQSQVNIQSNTGNLSLTAAATSIQLTANTAIQQQATTGVSIANSTSGDIDITNNSADIGDGINLTTTTGNITCLAGNVLSLQANDQVIIGSANFQDVTIGVNTQNVVIGSVNNITLNAGADLTTNSTTATTMNSTTTLNLNAQQDLVLTGGIGGAYNSVLQNSTANCVISAAGNSQIIGNTGVFVTASSGGFNVDTNLSSFNTPSGNVVEFKSATVQVSYIDNTGVYVPVSLREYKKNITNIDSCLDKILKLKPSLYSLKFDKENKIVPGLLHDEVDDFFKIKYERGLNYTGLIPYIIRSIQELCLLDGERIKIDNGVVVDKLMEENNYLKNAMKKMNENMKKIYEKIQIIDKRTVKKGDKIDGTFEDIEII